MALTCDTSVLVATFDRDDEEHERCAKLLDEIREPRIVPSPVLVEVDHLLGRYARDESFATVLAQVQSGALVVEDLVAEDYARVDQLLRTYDDLKVGFVDCAVLAIAERLGERKLATLDHRHFTVMRPRHCEALELLP